MVGDGLFEVAPDDSFCASSKEMFIALAPADIFLETIGNRDIVVNALNNFDEYLVLFYLTEIK